MKDIIEKIANKDYKSAKASMQEALSNIMEKKLWEIRKLIAAKSPYDKVKASKAKQRAKDKRTSLIVNPKTKNVKRVLQKNVKPTDIQAVEEAMIQKDGLVHLSLGEKVLRSVYNQRRWLSEGSGDVHPADDWGPNFAERHSVLSQKLKDDQTNPGRRAIQSHLDKAKKHFESDPEKAEDHLRQAEKLHRMSQGK